MAGLPPKADVAGKSLLPLIDGQTSDQKKPAFSQFLLGRFGAADKQKDQQKMGYTVRNNRHRYTVWYEWNKDDIRCKKLSTELYDHQTDP